MNVMTVTDGMADVQISVKNDPQGDSQGFATELNRASNTETADKDVKATADQKTVKEDQPEDRPDGAKEDKSKNTDQANTAQLMQGAIPVIVQVVQPEQVTAALAVQTEAAVAGTQTADTTAVQNTQQAAVQMVIPTGADQAQTVANTKQTVEVVKAPVQTEANGYAQAKKSAEAPAEDKAQVFANQAVQEIELLQKAQAQNAEQPVLTETPVAETPVAETPVAETPVAETPVAETPVAKAPVAETTTAQVPAAQQEGLKVQAQDQQQTQTQTQTQIAQQPVDVKDAAAQKTDGDGTSSEKKDQSGSQFQKQDTGIAQTQTTVWPAAGGNTAVQYHVAQAEQPAVPQTVATTIVDQVTTAVKDNKTEMVVQLKPEHLGGLAITLSMGEDGITAKMVTSQENVQNMIHNQMGALQDSLREKGIPVVHMEVIYDQTQNSAGFSHNGNSGQWATPQGSGSSQSAYNESEDSVNYHNFISSYDVLAEHGGSVEFSA
jgi:flagellar hook-length control protein FliK